MNAFVVTEKEEKFILPYVPVEFLNRGNLIVGCVDDKGTCVGVSIFQIREDTMSLRYIYVAMDYRRKGAGCAMIDFYSRVAKRNNIKGLEVNFFLDDDTESLIKFFMAMDFSYDKSRDNMCPEFTTTLNELLKNIPAIKRQKDYALSKLEDVTDKMYYIAKNELQKHSKHGNFIPLLSKESYDGRFSYMAFQNQELKGGIMVRKLSEECMEVSYIWTMQKNPLLLFAMINESLSGAKKELSNECIVRMIGYTNEGVALIRKLAGEEVEMRIPVRMLLAM
ncbi:MAG: GNAT family N-acetyltransferase [Butyrivibrio sp.]|nr:GNAT family N-acetyltransferase [Butyrivibrio sp.]